MDGIARVRPDSDQASDEGLSACRDCASAPSYGGRGHGIPAGRPAVGQPGLRTGQRRTSGPRPLGECWAASHRWQSRSHRGAKRCLDIAVGCGALLILLPVLLIVAVLVRISSPGPIMLHQQRIGKDGRAFPMHKFRTMFTNNDPAIHQAYYRSLVSGAAKPIGGAFKLSYDRRITPIGRVLRRLSLDELPQLLNVIKGEMSLVGPRPPLPFEVDLYDERARLRLSVTPGMTGLWQVSGRSALDFRQMIELDLAYIAGWSIWIDLLIVARTPFVLLAPRGAR